MENYAWLVAKSIFSGVPFMLLMCVIVVLLAMPGLLLNKYRREAATSYSIPYSLVNIYMYAGFGAYYRELFEYYSILTGRKFVVFIFCAIGIVLFYNSLKDGVNSLNSKPGGPYTYLDAHKIEAYVVQNMEMSWATVASFIIFSIFPTWISRAYGSLPNYLATLFT